MARTSHLRNALLLAVLASTPGLAMAVEPLDRLGFSAGTYVNRFDTTLRTVVSPALAPRSTSSVTWAWTPATSSPSPA